PALHRPSLDRLEHQPVGEKPQDSDRDNSHQNRVGLMKVARVVDQESKAGAGSDHLRSDQGAPAEPDAHANPCNDIRHRARNQYLKNNVASRATERAHGVLENPRDATDSHEGVVENQEEDRVEHDEDHTHPAEPEPGYRKREPGNSRERVKKASDRLEDRREPAPKPDKNPKPYR